MKKICWFFASALASMVFTLPVAAQRQADQTPIVIAQKGNRSACCQREYRACRAFCNSSRPSQDCWGDCDSRLATCGSTGVFAWKNRSSVNCG